MEAMALRWLKPLITSKDMGTGNFSSCLGPSASVRNFLLEVCNYTLLQLQRETSLAEASYKGGLSKDGLALTESAISQAHTKVLLLLQGRNMEIKAAAVPHAPWYFKPTLLPFAASEGAISSELNASNAHPGLPCLLTTRSAATLRAATLKPQIREACVAWTRCICGTSTRAQTAWLRLYSEKQAQRA